MKLSVSAYRAHASAHKKILSSSYQSTLNYGSTAASSSSNPANSLLSVSTQPFFYRACFKFSRNFTFFDVPHNWLVWFTILYIYWPFHIYYYWFFIMKSHQISCVLMSHSLSLPTIRILWTRTQTKTKITSECYFRTKLMVINIGSLVHSLHPNQINVSIIWLNSEWLIFTFLKMKTCMAH